MDQPSGQFPNKNLLLHLAFWIGFASLVYEIYAVKVLFLYFTESIYAVSITLSAFLAGLAFSSLIFSRVQTSDIDKIFSIIRLMQIALIVYALLILNNYSLIPKVFDYFISEFGSSTFVEFLKGSFVWIYLFIPGFFIGGAFPLLNGLYINSLETGVRETGLVYFWDTLGAILGTLVAGFLIIPYLGLEKSLLIPIVINGFIFTLLVNNKLQICMLILIATSVGLTYFPAFIKDPPTKKEVELKGITKTNLLLKSPDKRFGKILFQENSPFGVVTVGDNTWDIPGNTTLFVNYRPMCDDHLKGSEDAIGEFAVKQFSRKVRVLNIGLGCGITADAIIKQPNVEKLEICEINPVIEKAARKHFGDLNDQVLDNPKVNLTIQDGAEFLRVSKEKFDVVVIDIEEVSVVYSSPLYTRDYFKVIKNLLPDDGVVALWAIGNKEFAKVIYNTLKSTFSNVELRLLSGGINFYAADKELSIPYFGKDEEKRIVREILDSPIDSINTVDNRIAEKYFDILDVFELHHIQNVGQIDKFVSKSSSNEE